MERGAGASNIHMRFNLEPVTPGNVLLTKKVSGSDDIDYNLVEFPFQIWYKDEETGSEHLLQNDENIRVSYQNSIQRVEYVPSYTPPGSSETYQSVYFINPGKSTEIQFPANASQYRIVECGINHEVYDSVSVNDTPVEGTLISGTGRKSYDSGWSSMSDRPVIVFDNHVNPESLRTLSFEKRLFDDRGQELTAEQDSTAFDFRLYLSNGSDEDLELANMAKYYVTDPDRMLCTWDSATQKFISSDKNDYSALSAEEKAQFTFDTSIFGSISNIPSGYSVEIPNIPVGTKFRVDEREDEIPLGYRFQSYERVGGSYHPEHGDTLNSGWVRANESPKMIVNNRRGWSLEVKKEWSDKDFTISHDPVYIAVYCNNTLVPGTVSCIAHPSLTKRYFFDSLITGADFEDYAVYEVELDNPVVSEDGELVSYSGIHKRIENGGLTTINAVPSSTNTPAPHSYSVTYHYGTPSSPAGGTSVIENVRTDTITNTRADGVVLTLYDMHTREPLADGKFTLTKGDVTLGTFISDQQGRITILYDFERNEDYTLTETQPPSGYIGLPNPAVFSIGSDGTVTISGNEPQWQTGRKSDTPGDKYIAYIDVFNKPFSLTAIKVDSVTGEALSGAHFALYRSVEGIGGAVKDLYPIAGYEDLVSGSDGVIPGIDNTLAPGKYYLTEVTPPDGHDANEDDIIFTVFANGVVAIDSVGHSGYLSVEGTTECNYILRVPNSPNRPVELTITKTVTGAFGDKTKEFTFTLNVENAEPSDEYAWSKNGVPQAEPLRGNSTFTLRHGESVKITLPIFRRITITESNENYSTSFKLNDTAASVGNTKTFTLSGDSTLAVTNNLDAVIPTGVFHTAVGIAIIILAAFCLLAIPVILKRTQKIKG